MKFYHGTSDKCNITKTIIPPDRSGTLREDFRKDLQDVVFITNSVKSAESYAKKATKKFGGNPIVYRVEPVGYVWHKGNGDYLCYGATVLGITLLAAIKI